VPVHVPHGMAVSLTVLAEDGWVSEARQVDHWVDPREVEGQLIGEATFELDADLPLGYHVLRADLGDGSAYEAPVIVTPQRLEWPLPDRAWGVMAQLYQVRSRSSWGMGDLGDLTTLVRWAGQRLGADFALVNPLHAAQPHAPIEPSPYLPTTRRFASPLYLAVTQLPEYAALDGSARARVLALAEIAALLNSADRIDRDALWALKREALWLIFTTVPRVPAFGEFCDERGETLLRYATWCAIAETYADGDWPADLDAGEAGAVLEFAGEHDVLIEFHCWLQWALTEQLAAVQEAARSAGMRLGVVHDLAVGCHPSGADAWSLRDSLVRGVTVGAPPDQYNQLGQDWSQPPWHPQRLAETGYAAYREMVRAVLRDAGGLRVDHIIGLFRLWWVPAGHTPDRGAYVRYDHEALIGILVLEAQRAGAVVIGEDLGVVPAETRDYLRERGLLGTSIAWFERGADGHMLPPEAYRELCLSSVTTHDLPPTAGFLELAHVELRERLGLLTRPLAEERAAELATIADMVALLRAEGLLGPEVGVDEGAEAGGEAVVLALHRLLARTPSLMRGVALADLAGDRRIINQPGTSDEYPNWRVPLAGPDGIPVSLEQLLASPLPGRIAARLL
ncbi:MAG: 4-alpha-glucanotransferase, partial [Nocardioides sp.]